MPASAEARLELYRRLQARRQEIEEAILARVYGVADPGEASDPAYVEGLRHAVAAGVDYGLAGIERDERVPPPPPATLLVQARLAARSGISLDTVLRRYFAGYVLLGDFVLEEAQEGRLIEGPALKSLLRKQGVRFDQVIALVGEEHGRESDVRLVTADQRRAMQVNRLLAGERLDSSEFAYDFDACHLGVIAVGEEATPALRALSESLDLRLLLVCREEKTVDGWLGGQREVDFDELEELVSADWPYAVTLTTGEPGRGLQGWRQTHRQAKAALPVGARTQQQLTRYAHVALVASMLQDDLLATSLRQQYLAPLAEERDEGAALRQTLRAYLASGHNASSAAAALGVKRHTVTNRLRVAEERLGVHLTDRGLEIAAALRLEEFSSFAP